jgi:hypothetical protein
VVEDIQRLSGEQLVFSSVRSDVDVETPAAVGQPEAEAGELGRQSW